MLSREAQARLAVVLVGARNPQNIGAAARAMQDFGFNDLRVVNSFEPPFAAAQLEAKSAVGAGEVMRAAQLFSSLPQAIADCGLVVGTTAIGGRHLERPVRPLQQAIGRLRDALQQTPAGENEVPALRVALLFGSEKTGLTREELSFCTDLLTIPMFAPEGRHLSMNLGQSVAVCLYEMVREGFEGARELPEAAFGAAASGADRERLRTLVSAAMERSGYTHRFPANARPAVVRRLVEHLGTTHAEAATWMGLFKMLFDAAEGGAHAADRSP